jgi:hypothetical protein
MAAPVFDLDESGDLATGYFYSIDTTLTRHRIHGQTKEWITSSHEAEARFVWTPGGTETSDRHACPRDGSHETGAYYTSVGLDLCGGDIVGPFVPAWGNVILVNKKLADQLLESGLPCVQTTPASVVLNQSACKDPNIHLLVFAGRDPTRWPRIYPETANRCPYCGHGPIVCPECGFWYAYCPKCAKEWCRCADEAREGVEDLRLVIRPFPKLGPIIDPNRWDGSDFMPYCIVTRRVLDFFLSVHAAPLRAQPIRVDLRGITDEKRDLVERAKGHQK